MSVLSTLNNNDRRKLTFAITSSISLSIWIYAYYKRKSKNNKSKLDEKVEWFNQKNDRQKQRDRLNLKIVLKQVHFLLSHIAGKKEFAYAVTIAASLIAKTLNDLWLIENATKIEAAIITANFQKLKENLGSFALAMPTLALINNLLKYSISELRLSLRYKLSQYLYQKYISGLTYYRINTFDANMQNLDQLLTSDIEKFSNCITDVYTNISKPLLDIIVLIQQLSKSYTGIQTPATMIGYLAIAGTILTIVRKPLTRLTVKETQLEGQLRFVHSRLIANCEEIALLKGNKKEKSTLLGALERLKDHLGLMNVFRFNVDFVDNLFARYIATVVGYLGLAIPFFSARYESDSHSVRLETYYKSGRMVVKLAESIGRLALAGRDFARLSAYTQRVTELMNSIEKNKDNLFAKSVVERKTKKAPATFNRGLVKMCDLLQPIISFESVPLCTPNGDILVDSLTFTIYYQQNVLITGPNGSGKSSLFRLIHQLWPLYGGKLVKPPNDKLFYIPQKPYLVLGTLRDQLIYPSTYDDFLSKGGSDNDLINILDIVELKYLYQRESFDSTQDWSEILSGGEKQRVALARLIYHRPLFCMLDECTSAVSIDVEQRIYKYLTNEIKCTLLSVTHRVKQLQHFHTHELKFDGNGGYSFDKL